MRPSEEHRQDLLDKDEPDLDRKDSIALWLSGRLTIGLPCLLMILLIVGVTMLLFGH